MKLSPQQRKDFVSLFVKDIPGKVISVYDFGKKMHDLPDGNHEIWRKCSRCGDYNDFRKTDCCENCGVKLK